VTSVFFSDLMISKTYNETIKLKVILKEKAQVSNYVDKSMKQAQHKDQSFN